LEIITDLGGGYKKNGLSRNQKLGIILFIPSRAIYPLYQINYLSVLDDSIQFYIVKVMQVYFDFLKIVLFSSPISRKVY